MVERLVSGAYLRVTVIVSISFSVVLCFFFFFQAEDGIRDLVRSRGLGDVYKRQTSMSGASTPAVSMRSSHRCMICSVGGSDFMVSELSLIHI